MNFRRIFRICGKFSEISANFLHFPENFRNFRRIFGGKRQNKGISRYAILEVRYDILFDTLKVSIYWHSIISRYDKPIPALDVITAEGRKQRIDMFELVGKGLRGVLIKYCFSSGFCPNTSPPPPSPKFGQFVQLFSNVAIQDLKESLGLKILYVICIILYMYTT